MCTRWGLADVLFHQQICHLSESLNFAIFGTLEHCFIFKHLQTHMLEQCGTMQNTTQKHRFKHQNHEKLMF